MPPPQDGHTYYFFLAYHLRTAGGGLSLSHNPFLHPLVQAVAHLLGIQTGFAKELAAAQVSVFLLCTLLLEINFNSRVRAKPTHSSAFTGTLQKICKNWLETIVQFTFCWAMLFPLRPPQPGSDTQPCAAPCTWQGDGELGLAPRNLFLNWLCCIT